MNKLEQLLDPISTKTKNNVSSNNKRKWREIEQLKEKFQLEKELKAYEDDLQFMLEDS